MDYGYNKVVVSYRLVGLYSMLYRIKKTLREHWCKRTHKLLNKDISIISMNCVGGCVYHDYGLRFMSPTINLSFSASDFVKFCENIEGYLAEELRFVCVGGGIWCIPLQC